MERSDRTNVLLTEPEITAPEDYTEPMKNILKWNLYRTHLTLMVLEKLWN